MAVKRLVEFPLEDGSSVFVEVDEPEGAGGTVRAARPGELAEKAQVTFEEAVQRIRPAAEAILGKLRDLQEPPDQVAIEYGLKLNAQAGAIVASASADAHYKVTLSWRRKEG